MIWSAVTSGQNFYVNELEVIKLTTSVPEYQYHLKDHLGNVRLTFTTKNETDSALATMETANATAESGKFLYYSEAVMVNAEVFDHTNGGGSYYSTRLNGSANERTGLARSLSVMPGDTIKAGVYAKYLDTNSSNWTTALNNLITSIANGTAPAGTFVDGGATGSTGGVTAPYLGLLDKSSETGTAPKAYLNYLIFDRDYNMLDGGFVRMTDAAREYGQDGAHERLASQFVITQPGYVYIYLSNDNAASGGQQVEVYFDDFKVEQAKSSVVKMDDYYPFGLTFNSYERENNVDQKFKFQGQEHIDDLGLGWVAFKWRNDMPEIGRFFNVDPLAESFYYNSPYAFSENKVTSHIELEGLEAWDIKAEWNEDNIKEFQQYSAAKAEETYQSGENFICEDFVVEVLVSFASENGLPVTIQNESGNYDASSADFGSVDDYKNAVMKSTGAKDLQKNGNTTEVPLGDVQQGDMLLSRWDDGPASHVQQVTSVDGDNVNIHQGNQRGLSSDPESMLYGGTDVQKGTWNRKSDVYKREDSPTKKQDYSKVENVQGRRWNYSQFNAASRRNQPGPRKGTNSKDY